MEIRDQDHYRQLFDKLYGKFISEHTKTEDVNFMLMDAHFKQCFELMIRGHFSPYDTIVEMVKHNIQLSEQNLKLIQMMPNPINPELL